MLQTHSLKQKNPTNQKKTYKTSQTKTNQLPEKQNPTCDCRKTCMPRKWAGCVYTQNIEFVQEEGNKIFIGVPDAKDF